MLGALVAAVSICLQPVDDGCGVFHAYQTVISQLRENYHFLLRVTFQRSHRTLNPSCIKWIVDTLICLFFPSSLLLPLCPGVMMVIPFKKKKKSPSIVLFFSTLSSSSSSSVAADAAVLSTLILFHRLHTQAQTMGCVMQTAGRLQENTKLGCFFFSLLTVSLGGAACVRACGRARS